MGTWDASLFADDFALDVRETYLALLADGAEDAAATRAMIEDFASEDPDEEPMFWLALAAVQWEYGRVDEEVQRRALAVIASGAELERWGQLREKRSAVLAKLAAQLQSPPPRRKKPRRRKQIEVPTTVVASPDGRWRAEAFEIANAVGRLGQVGVSTDRGGGGVFAADCSYSDIEMTWLDAHTLEIAHPPVEVQKARPSQFVAGETVHIVYRVRER